MPRTEFEMILLHLTDLAHRAHLTHRPRRHRPRRELLRLAVLAVIAGNVFGRSKPADAVTARAPRGAR